MYLLLIASLLLRLQWLTHSRRRRRHRWRCRHRRRSLLCTSKAWTRHQVPPCCPLIFWTTSSSVRAEKCRCGSCHARIAGARTNERCRSTTTCNTSAPNSRVAKVYWIIYINIFFWYIHLYIHLPPRDLLISWLYSWRIIEWILSVSNCTKMLVVSMLLIHHTDYPSVFVHSYHLLQIHEHWQCNYLKCVS